MDSQKKLTDAIENEGRKFKEHYLWIEKSMPAVFYQEVSPENMVLITHALMGFDLQDYFSTINLRGAAIVMCLDDSDADLRILEDYVNYGIKNYRAFVSKSPPPFKGIKSNLRIAIIHFTEALDKMEDLPHLENEAEIRALLKQRNSEVDDNEFNHLMRGMNARFLKTLSSERLILALDMFFRAKTRDNCQYEVRYDEAWEEKDAASMEIILAWRNTPKHNFLYRLARVIHRNGLVMKRVTATYVDPYSKNSILIMILGLHGSKGQAAWEAADIREFLRELVTVKYFASFDAIDHFLVSKGIINGNSGNLVRSMVNFIHQGLVHIDPYFYTTESIEESFCRHPDLTAQLCVAFEKKFHPDKHNYSEYLEERQKFINIVQKLDTGQEENDTRRRNVLLQAMNMVHHTLKTNFYRTNYTSLAFRLDPKYMDELPFDRTKKFPELPYAIFFIKGMHFFGFHIRFKDLARGGLRTVYPQQTEQLFFEQNVVFTENYNLAYTQQLKNKDIPEGGAKGLIFLRPYDRLVSETDILQREFEAAGLESQEIEQKLKDYKQEQSTEFLHQAQRSYIDSLLTLVVCDPDGSIRAKYIVDYWKRPEYLYIGPDENMHDEMIEWIANLSKKYNYRPGTSFISSKPRVGINHKEYGVTSLGVNVYLHEILKYIGIDPEREKFTIKMSGGPDGDVAGNEILNLQKYYPKTAKLTALTDVSGTINSPEGLDLNILADLFRQGRPIRYYPPEKLSEGGFLVDRQSKRTQSALVQQTLCWRKINGKVMEDWLSGSDMNTLFRHNVHQTKTDVFIPAGGRPRTLNETNIKDFLDDTGKPTSKAIIEGANLYLTQKARRHLETLGVLIVKDSSANKTGVICSSFEVLSGLTLGDDLFLENKKVLVQEILERLKQCAFNEASLMLRTHQETGAYLTDISELISKRINQYTYQLLDYLDPIELDERLDDPLIKNFLSYAPPLLRNKYKDKLLQQIPDHHKKAIIACHVAAHIVYHRGLNWMPSIVDILPILIEDSF